MDEEAEGRLARYAIWFVVGPILLGIVALGLGLLARGDLVFGLQCVTFAPVCLVCCLIYRRILRRKEALAEPSRGLRFWECYVQLFPLIVGYSFLGISSEMSTAQAVFSVLKLLGILSVSSAIFLLMVDRAAERFWPAKPE